MFLFLLSAIFLILSGDIDFDLLITIELALVFFLLIAAILSTVDTAGFRLLLMVIEQGTLGSYPVILALEFITSFRHKILELFVAAELVIRLIVKPILLIVDNELKLLVNHSRNILELLKQRSLLVDEGVIV